MRKTAEIPHVLNVLRKNCGRDTAFSTAFSKGPKLQQGKTPTTVIAPRSRLPYPRPLPVKSYGLRRDRAAGANWLWQECDGRDGEPSRSPPSLLA